MAVTSQNVPFEYYSSGIIDSKLCSADVPSHAVLAVGYGVDTTIPDRPREYITIKNTWGTSWGENGFARIALDAKDHPNRYGVCGMLDQNVMATIDLKNVPRIQPEQ